MVKGKPVCEHAPKRPLSGYFLFAADVRPKIQKADPDCAMKDIMAQIGKQWGELNDKKKNVFNDKAAKAKETYDKKFEKYKKTKHYAKHQEAILEWKKTQNSKPFKKDPNRPKKGLSAYLIFVNEQRPKLTKQGFEMLEVSKEAGKMWGKLSEKDKAPYMKKAAKAKAAAEKEMEKYKKSKQYKKYAAEKEEYEEKQKARKKAEKASEKAAEKKESKKK